MGAHGNCFTKSILMSTSKSIFLLKKKKSNSFVLPPTPIPHNLVLTYVCSLKTTVQICRMHYSLMLEHPLTAGTVLCIHFRNDTLYYAIFPFLPIFFFFFFFFIYFFKLDFCFVNLSLTPSSVTLDFCFCTLC